MRLSLGTGVGSTVVLNTALLVTSVKFGGFAISQREVQAARPYGSAVSVAVAFELGSHFPQVVYEREDSFEVSCSGGAANVVVVVGDGRGVA